MVDLRKKYQNYPEPKDQINHQRRKKNTMTDFNKKMNTEDSICKPRDKKYH